MRTISIKTMVVLAAMVALAVTGQWAVQVSQADPSACWFADDPNNPEDPQPEPEVFSMTWLDEDPNGPEVNSLIRLDEDPNKPDDPQPGPERL